MKYLIFLIIIWNYSYSQNTNNKNIQLSELIHFSKLVDVYNDAQMDENLKSPYYNRNNILKLVYEYVVSELRKGNYRSAYLNDQDFGDKLEINQKYLFHTLFANALNFEYDFITSEDIKLLKKKLMELNKASQIDECEFNHLMYLITNDSSYMDFLKKNSYVETVEVYGFNFNSLDIVNCQKSFKKF